MAQNEGEVMLDRAIGLTDQNVNSSWCVSIDGLIAVGRRAAIFEAFTGEPIGTYNAAIGQSLNPEDGEGIATVGGFAEIWCKPVDCLVWHVGYGTDDPHNQDLGQILDNTGTPIAGQKARHAVDWTNWMWNVTDFFQLGFEVSRRETAYIAPRVSNEAMIYHFRSRLTI
ncbi:hypothetical protein CA13_28590 [Planctomycetes bacterium CA13]|uniref:Uncharacterized protein n=1 Tax=Novipirellula herctigrandis TaxID=2527986 RepID=A0A5C5Z302_9BACT|nr:hypothetical protein CA13_28590 [Planctomycetes bacterium CA13]